MHYTLLCPSHTYPVEVVTVGDCNLCQKLEGKQLISFLTFRLSNTLPALYSYFLLPKQNEAINTVKRKDLVMLNSKKRFCLLSFLNLTLNYFTGTIKLQFRTITIIVDRDKPWIQIWDEILVTAQGRIPFPLFWIWLGLGLWTGTWPQACQFWPCGNCNCEPASSINQS